uniref:Putative splicing factor splicing factor n=1 Tax=Nyssomyia neivai TaxID=330878 RepID=A0A1L8DI38_9DIPT
MQPRTKVFVGSVPQGTQPEDLRRLFEKFGVVTECDIMNRCGFVHMQTQEMADAAIAALNNTTFRGTTISVERGRMKERGAGGGGGVKKGPGGGMMNQRGPMGGNRGPMGPGGPRGGPMGMRGPPGGPGGMNRGPPRGNMRGPMGGGDGGNPGGPMRRDRGPNNRPNPYQRDPPDFKAMRGRPGQMRNNMDDFAFDDLPPMDMYRGGMMDRGSKNPMSNAKSPQAFSNKGMMDRGGPMGGSDRFDDDNFGGGGFSNEDRRGFALPEWQMFNQDDFDDRRAGFDDMRRGGGPPMRGGNDFGGAGDFMGRNGRGAAGAGAGGGMRGGDRGGDMFSRRGPPMRGGAPRGRPADGNFDMDGGGYNQAFPPLGSAMGNRNGPPRRW